MKIQHIAAVLVLSASLAVAGCQVNTGRSPSAGSGSGSGAGSSSGKIPDNARKIAEAKGSRVVHRTLRDGTVYVYDTTSKKVVYAGPVRANANIVIDPKADNVSVNDTEVTVNDKLDPGHRYALYFVQQ
jgi:hypothetical protein